MGCNCGGTRGSQAARVAALRGKKTMPGEKWIVRFPNGQSKEFDQHWKAENARHLLGGTIAHVSPGGSPPDSQTR